jgi:hypothetical protein
VVLVAAAAGAVVSVGAAAGTDVAVGVSPPQADNKNAQIMKSDSSHFRRFIGFLSSSLR